MSRERLIYIFAIILFLGSFSWYQFSGPIADDYVYMHEMKCEYMMDQSFNNCEGELITTFKQALDSSVKHYFFWGNARLGSYLMFFINLVPRWVVNIFNAFFLTAFFMLIARCGLGRSWRRRPLEVMILAWMLWVAYPWQEFLLATSFAMNYVWAPAVLLFFLLKWREKSWPMWGICLLAFAGSVMQEALSVAVCLLLFIICMERLLRRGWDGKLMWPALVFLFGSLLIIFCPGIYMRSDGGGFFSRGLWMRGVIQAIVLNYWVFPIAIAMLCYTYFKLPRRLWKKYMLIAVPLLVIALLNMAMLSIINFYNARGSAMGYAFCLIVIGRGMKMLIHKEGRKAGYIAAGLLVLMGIWMAGVATLTYESKQQRLKVKEEYIRTQNPIVYVDARSKGDYPWWSMSIPVSPHSVLYYSGFHYYNLYMKDKSIPLEMTNLSILPESFRGKRLNELDSVPGTMKLFGRDGVYLTLNSRYMYDALYMTYAPDERFSNFFTSPRNPIDILRTLHKGKNLRIEDATLQYIRPVILRSPAFGMNKGDTIYVCDRRFIEQPRIVNGLKLVQADTITHDSKKINEEEEIIRKFKRMGKNYGWFSNSSDMK